MLYITEGKCYMLLYKGVVFFNNYMDVGYMEVYSVTQRHRTHGEIMTVSPNNVPTHWAMLFNRDGFRTNTTTHHAGCESTHKYISKRVNHANFFQPGMMYR